MNKKTVQEILAYLPGLQDHADKFAYYGEPADAFYDEYDAEDEHGNHLVVSQECNEMCETIGADLQNGESWETGSASRTSSRKICRKISNQKIWMNKRSVQHCYI